MLCLAVCRKNQAMHPGQVLPTPGLGEGQLKFQSSQGSSFAVRLNDWNSLQLYSSAWLKLQGRARGIPAGGAIASPQAWRAVLCLRKMASAVWGMTQHRDPGGCSFSSLPRATNPWLSSCISSPLCPPSAAAQGKWDSRCDEVVSSFIFLYYKTSLQLVLSCFFRMIFL